jgi:hypothetical protein
MPAQTGGYSTILSPNFRQQREAGLIEGLYRDSDAVDIETFVNSLDGVAQINTITVDPPGAPGEVYSLSVAANNTVEFAEQVQVVSEAGDTDITMAEKLFAAYQQEFALQAVVNAELAAPVITLSSQDEFTVTVSANLTDAPVSTLSLPEVIGYGLVVWTPLPVVQQRARGVSVVDLATEAQGVIRGITTRSDIYGVRDNSASAPVDGFPAFRPVPVVTNGRICVRAVTDLVPGGDLYVFFQGANKGRLGGTADPDAFQITNDVIKLSDFVAGGSLGFVKANF